MGLRSKVMMFVGAIMIAICLFVNLPVSFGVWLVLFLFSMFIAGAGAVLAIIELAKSIKEEAESKAKSQ